MPKVVPVRHNLDHKAKELIAASEGDDDDLLTTREMAAWFNVSTQFFEIGRHLGYGPRFVLLAPKVVRYRRGDARKYLAERRHQCTDEYRPRKRKRGT